MVQVQNLYDHDFYAWTQQQADLLRHHQFNNLDVANLLEEIISMGKSERRELTARLEILLIHLLKWFYQPNFQSNSWRLTIEEQRERLKEHLADNPSLTNKKMLEEDFVKAYKHARIGAAKQTGLEKKTFPEKCPWTIKQVMSNDFYPAP